MSPAALSTMLDERNAIAVGVDFEQPSEIAWRHAAGLARSWDAPLILIHLIPSHGGLSMRLAEAVTKLREDQRLLAQRRLADIAGTIASRGVEVRRELIDGVADDELGNAAAETGARLLVVGSHGHGRIARFFLGSVAERSARISEIDVLVARAAEATYRRILVPIDFAVRSTWAVDRAVAMAGPETEIDLLHCVDSRGSESLAAEALTEGMRKDAAGRGARMVERNPHRRMRYVDRIGSPALGIIEQLDDADYELVVMGSHGRTGLKRLLLGSVAERIVRHAPCSVLIVKHPLEPAPVDNG
jgi:nucleotide-binding universal stress UspA family protein